MKFHSIIIRFCLSLTAKSVSCFEELRNSGVLKFSSQRTIRDYRNFVKSKPGFNKPVNDELVGLTKSKFRILIFNSILCYCLMKLR